MVKIILCILISFCIGCASKKTEPPKNNVLFILPKPQLGPKDREAVRNSIKSTLSDFRVCYETQLKTDPNSSGKIIVEFVIGSTGRIQESKIIESDFVGSDSMNKCVLKCLQNIEFPKPDKNITARVTYPFVFKNDK